MQPFQLNFEAIGTRWSIDILDGKSDTDQQQLFATITKRIAEFDHVYSRFNPDSLICTIAQKKGTYTFPDDAKTLIDIYDKLYHITDGAVTPLIGKLMEEAGYDKAYSLQTRTLHHPPAWDETMVYTHPTLVVKKPVLLDFGAAGKGYLVDIIAALLLHHTVTSFCIDAGGDIVYKTTNQKNLRVGLEHPENTAQVIGVAEIKNQAICGSAGNRRKWGNFHHIISPKSLSSPQHILALWVIADTAIVADAIATALYFCKAQTLQKHFQFEYLMLYPDYSVEKSFAFPAELFYNKET